MATIYHFPSICLTATKKLCSSSSFVSGTGTPLNVEELLLHPPPHHPITSCKSRLVVASSGKKSRTGKKSKVTRSTKSNADLCSELREFISMTCLPENSVPSMKVLSEHGRKDLANIVRRRGYKLIAELLMNTTEVDTNIEGNLIENHDACNINGNDSADGQEKRTDELQEDVLLSSKASILEEQLSNTKSDAPSGLDVTMSESTGYLENSSLHEKASNFVRSGVLETIEGALSIEEMQMLNSSDVSYGSFEPAATDSVLGDAESENAVGIEATTGCQSTSISETVEGNVAPILDTGAVFPKRVVVLAEDHKPHRDDIFPSEEPNSPDVDQDQASKRDNQIEINCLKEMLQQKELELSQLKQQIEKEKLTLSILQSKGNAELGNAQKVVLAKDAELHAAEESLSSLKEVEIEYWGNGEIVEVAGSFNGWHHPILMDRHASSKAIDPTVLRNSILWYTVLWLYPGIYEIKFIVDGNWRIDPQKEFVTRGHIQNNILRVDR